MAIKIPIMNDFEKYFKFIIIGDDNCWNWSGFTDKDGYGKINRNYKCYFSHRFFYDVFVGIKDESTVIDHICKNRKCCNPDHLREVSCKENANNNSNSPIAMNAQKTHCIRGHELIHPNIYAHNNRRRCKKCNLSLAKKKRESRKCL